MRRTMTATMALLLVGATSPPDNPAQATTAPIRAGQERVVTGDGILTTRIAGLAARTRIDPSAPAMPLIDLAVAERAKLKLEGSWGFSVIYSIGGTMVSTRTQVVPVDFGDGVAKRRVGWAPRPFAPGVDVSVGPAAMPEPVVRFQLRAPKPGETTVVLPAMRETALLGMFGNFSTTFARIDVGGAPMRVRFDPYHARSLATAGAAVRLAAAHDGVVSGTAVPIELFFGIERPVRDLTLRRPLMVGALRIAALGVRTHDFGNAGAITEADARAPDPDEIVVTAKGKARDMRRDTISLGADQLRHCSSIVFDRKADTVSLTCGG